jgi:hypothetical protein
LHQLACPAHSARRPLAITPASPRCR